MKKPLAIISMALVTSCASHFGEGWTTGDTIRQVAVTGVIAYDLKVQTPRFVESEKRRGPYHEKNPIITEENLDLYTAGCISGHLLVSGYLKPKYRKWWQYAWIVIQGITIAKNAELD